MEQNKSELPFLIYCIDDDCEDFEILKEVIREKWTDIRLVHFENPVKFLEALDYLEIPAIVVLDINMPFFNGFEVMNAMKKHKRWNNMPFLFLTTASDENNREQAMAGGAMQFITKPSVMKDWKKVILELERIQKEKEEILFSTKK